MGFARELRHLARRFFSSRHPAAPSAHDVAVARAVLSETEMDLWLSQAVGDRRHSADVARVLQARVGPGLVPAWVLAAALLHDIGKIDTDLGVAARVVAAVLKLARFGTFPGAIGRYLHYPQVGAARLSAAGSDPRTVAWAAEHHWSARRWTTPAPWAGHLRDADHQAV